MSTNLTKPELEKIGIDDFVNALGDMIENDKSLLPSQEGFSPKVWECKWYNIPQDNENRSQYYYKAGDSVWLNTEDPVNFASVNRQKIISYVLDNSYLRNIYETLKDDDSKLQDFLVSVVKNEINGNSNGTPMFYLGDLSSKVRIKVSKYNNNDKTPDNQMYWQDFFKTSDVQEFQDQLLSTAELCCKNYMSQHLMEYHLSGIQKYWNEEYGQSKNLEDIYLKQDFSNFTGGQEYNLLPGKQTSGFDFVLRFYRKKFSGKSSKWFRVWNSGLVEHGGIVDSQNPTVSQDKTIYLDGSSIKTHYFVNLAWTCDSTDVPVYKYATTSTGYYYEDECIDMGDGHQIEIEDLAKEITDSNRYVVQLTPITMNAIPYQTMHTGANSGIYYMSKDINSMTNTSFCFPINKEARYYSYHVIGFVKNIQFGYK